MANRLTALSLLMTSLGRPAWSASFCLYLTLTRDRRTQQSASGEAERAARLANIVNGHNQYKQKMGGDASPPTNAISQAEAAACLTNASGDIAGSVLPGCCLSRSCGRAAQFAIEERERGLQREVIRRPPSRCSNGLSHLAVLIPSRDVPGNQAQPMDLRQPHHGLLDLLPVEGVHDLAHLNTGKHIGASPCLLGAAACSWCTYVPSPTAIGREQGVGFG